MQMQNKGIGILIFGVMVMALLLPGLPTRVSGVEVASASAPQIACDTVKTTTSKSPAAALQNDNENCVPDTGIYGNEMRALMAEMSANPSPDVKLLPVDERMLYQKGFRKVVKETDVYGTPGGQVVGHIANGFNFVNAGLEQNGWVQIGPNKWLPSTVLGPINKAVSKFSGVLLDGMPDRPFGWILMDTKPSRTPGAKPISGTSQIARYTLVNFFASEEVDGWKWYLIGPNQWVIETRVARPKSVKRPNGVNGKWFAVDLYEQTMIAYDNDKAVFATLISSGLPYWTTTEGLFKIWDRYLQVKMSGASGLPDNYYLPQVPWVMYFNKDEQALHGAYWHDGFGYRRSHGCVNLSLTDAKWAFEWTQSSPEAWVYVYHSDEYRNQPPR